MVLACIVGDVRAVGGEDAAMYSLHGAEVGMGDKCLYGFGHPAYGQILPIVLADLLMYEVFEAPLRVFTHTYLPFAGIYL